MLNCIAAECDFLHLLDIGACEVVLKTKTKENFERRLRAEHSMFYVANVSI